MKMSTKGQSMLKEFEGFRSTWYKCSGGRDTIGYGFTRLYYSQDTITRLRADEILEAITDTLASKIEKLVAVPLNQNQLDALISFVYNIGITEFKKSTLLKKLNKGLYDEVPSELARWNKANSRVDKGLVRRRAAEGKLFLVSEKPAQQSFLTIITPTTGSRHLKGCLESVQNQTNHNVLHLVVVDGPEFQQAAQDILNQVPVLNIQRQVLVLPENTGAGGYNGHRIYGAMSFCINTPYVSFLDEDNTLDPTHCEHVYEQIAKPKKLWGFTHRQIIEQDGSYVCQDACESLGPYKKNVLGDCLIDVNCVVLSVPLAIRYAWIWYRKARDPLLREEVDRLMTRLLSEYEKPETMGQIDTHTINYRVGNRPDSVQAKFFLLGNRKFLT